MRLLILISLIILTTLPSFASTPVAVWTAGKPDGITLVQHTDGQWGPSDRSDRPAVELLRTAAPPNHYLYFVLAPETRLKLDSEAYLVVDFLDKGVRQIGVQFNAEGNPYQSATGFILAGTDKWERALIHLTGAKFQGLQNAGADLRLCDLSGTLTISRLEVYAEKPDFQIPADRERIMKHIWMTPKLKDMYYTFGNDLDEAGALLYRSLGVTSVESYVTWETCEREAEGKWDWSQWDKQVKILKDAGLKWVPFIILSPAYSTPNWFRAGKDHFPCRCLEHGIDSKIESLWNPNLPKWIDRFIAEFAKRYRDSGVIESVLLGIQGDFGEAIYSVSGGGWTFNVPGEYHNHAGYWCDDPYALADYRKFLQARYKTISALNKAWGAEFKSFEEADFPGRKEELAAFERQLPPKTPEMRRRWLDFIDWYRAAMTEWSDWWIGTTKKHFPNTPIYLCTGGDAEPHHGSNFAEQCRVAAKHGQGVRITNEASDYAQNFMITRWVAAAGKHYGAFYGFEPAGAEDEKGIVARIYNATASGANQLHDYTPNVISSESRMAAQRAHFKYLFRVRKTIVPVALWYPNVYLTLHWSEFLHPAAEFRDYADFDYVDESMLRTGALDKYKVLVVIAGPIMETSDARLIAKWLQKGGRMIVMDVPKFESVEGTSEPDDILNCWRPDVLSVVGGGVMHRVQGWDGVAAQLGEDLKHFGLPVYDLAKDGIFGTQIGPKRFLFLNTTDAEVTVPIRIGDATHQAVVKPGTITDVKL
jgi:hypothetical protein